MKHLQCSIAKFSAFVTRHSGELTPPVRFEACLVVVGFPPAQSQPLWRLTPTLIVLTLPTTFCVIASPRSSLLKLLLPTIKPVSDTDSDCSCFAGRTCYITNPRYLYDFWVCRKSRREVALICRHVYIEILAILSENCLSVCKLHVGGKM